MLNQLPNEIIMHVLSYLSKSDLLACLTVNQSLYQLVVPILYINVHSSDISRISQGLQFFCSNPAIAKYVRSVKLRVEKECDNVEKLSLIPNIFTNLRELHVNADYKLAASTQIEPECQYTLQALSIRERGVSFAAGLLESGTFTSLTHLRISFLQNFWDGNSVIVNLLERPQQAMIEMGKKLIQCFVHLPVLTALNISHAKFDLADIERLHSELPGLRELTLINTCFPSNSTTSTTAKEPDIRPAVNLSSFHLTLRPARPDIGKVAMQRETQRNLTEWLVYIEHKYTRLKALTMEITDSDGNEFDLVKTMRFDAYNAVKNQMQRVVRKLDGIEKIETQLFPFNESNMNLCSKYALQAVKLFDYDLDIETQMRNLHDSKQHESIHSLSVAFYNPDYYHNIDTMRQTFRLYHFNGITNINIKSVLGSELCGLEYRLLLHLLQYVPSLEMLKVWSIHVTDKKIPNLAKNRLKCLEIFRFHVAQNWKASNKYLQTLLQASPLLETFSTTLKIGYRERQYRFVLDLTGNKHLKTVCLEYFDQDTCLLLEHDPKRTKKYWKTLTTSIEKPAHVNRYSLIDLRWNDSTKVDAYSVPPPGYH
ncbi:hypothetical protein MBANPS3_001413 [Mucor bainieri]